MMPCRRDLLQLIERAMREKAPQMYGELLCSGKLQQVLADRADHALDSYLDGLSKAMEAPGETHQELVSNGFQARNEAARQALDQAVEFAAPMEADEDGELTKSVGGDGPKLDSQGSRTDGAIQVLYWNENPGGKTDITLTLKPDGSLELFYYDIGPDAKQIWGDSDFEHWVTIPSELLPLLAFQLLADKYRNRPDAVSDLQKFCARHSITNVHHSWA